MRRIQTNFCNEKNWYHKVYIVVAVVNGVKSQGFRFYKFLELEVKRKRTSAKNIIAASTAKNC